MNNALLDKVLFRAKQIYLCKDVPRFSEQETRYESRVYDKLDKDGYVKIVVTENGNNKRTSRNITFEGLLALEEPPLWWKNKPYQWKVFKDNAKVYAAFLNTFILLVLAILTYLNIKID